MEVNRERVEEAVGDLTELKRFLHRFQELTEEAEVDDDLSNRMMTGLIDIALDMTCPGSEEDRMMRSLWDEASAGTKADIVRVMMTMTDDDGLFHRLSRDCFVRELSTSISALISRLKPC